MTLRLGKKGKKIREILEELDEEVWEVWKQVLEEELENVLRERERESA
ncbi:MAG: hypothetical protein GSR72_00240 [Desulfurococcales archaeon]|nr:hypothetical protein [Desulfurococcales archaeon]